MSISDRQKGTKKRKWLKIILFTFLAAFVFSGSVVAYFAFRVQTVTSHSPELVRGTKSELREEPVQISHDNFSILFLGLDDRDGTLEGRTDALILATFNAEQGTVKMVSIPRDSLVEIPGREKRDKINHAHAYGGLDLAIETVENMFSIPVDYYVRLNFTAFVEIIDALGGIEINVPYTFTEQDSQDRQNAITLYEGWRTLNGEEALAYARMRYHDPTGDIGRGERQQEIIKATIKKAASISSVTKYSELLDSLEDHLTTNISFTNMLALHKYRNSLGEIESLKLEGEGISINGIYYYKLSEESLESVKQELRKHLLLEKDQENIINEEDKLDQQIHHEQYKKEELVY